MNFDAHIRTAGNYVDGILGASPNGGYCLTDVAVWAQEEGENGREAAMVCLSDVLSGQYSDEELDRLYLLSASHGQDGSSF